MRVLFVGDIVGKAGRRCLQENLRTVQNRERVDFTIVNVENAAGGHGVTGEIADSVLDLGVDVMTTGNHVWDQKGIQTYLERQPRLLRPGNYPPGLPGRGTWTGTSACGVPVAVVNLQGRVFMPLTDCPFRWMDQELKRLSSCKVIIVDFHAEATSEKMAFAWYVDGKTTAVIGTHTHVPTSDTRLLSQGTAFVSDVGMTGPYDSVIGMQIPGSLERFLTSTSARFEPETRNPRFSAVVVEADDSTGRAISIRRCDVPETF